MAEDRFTGERAISKRRARFWNAVIWTVIVLIVLTAVYIFLGTGSDVTVGDGLKRR